MTNGKQTEYLLKSISQRLAGREDCKDAAYEVRIGNFGVSMDPLVYVFPDCHKRKESDKLSIVTYINEYKIRINPEELVWGIYRYDWVGKKRKWRKVD